MANMVTDKLLEIADEGYSSSNVESVMGVTSGSDSSAEMRREPPTKKQAGRRTRGRRTARGLVGKIATRRVQLFSKNIVSRRVSEISRHFSKIFWQDILSQNVSSWKYFSASLVYFNLHVDVVLSLQSSYKQGTFSRAATGL